MAWRLAGAPGAAPRRAFDFSAGPLFRAALLVATRQVLLSRYSGAGAAPHEMGPLLARMRESTVA